MTAIVQPILDAGILVECDPVPAASGMSGKRAGKPAKPLWFSDSVKLGGVYLFGDGVHCAVFRMDGEIALEHRMVWEGVPTVADVLVTCESFFDGVPVSGVGVAAAGMVDTEAGVLLELYLASELAGMPVVQLLRERLGVPVVVDHHPRVQAIGDLWFGIGRELAHFASLHTGEVLGVGMVLNGRIVRGPYGAGGEVGHMVVDLNGERCVCGRIGCWETVATLPWLRREAMRVGLAGAAEMTCADLVGLAATDMEADELLHRYLRNIAQGIANLEQVLGLGHYLIHGDVGHGGAVAAQIISESLSWSLNRRRPLPEITLVADDDRSTLLGAAGLLLSTRFDADVDR
ncbi:ROK family protein [Brachybacterium sp. p3-SID957]|uniref:ROK family protein n=1 Tax=Brachybacterium sp. p3-SID957 TaxID=2916049 RepID=UPI00223B40EF|nr:ROK family protein [Brachybacterium sp. p3-SID957]MCT1777201.1 ROK family protein [Brachybacterium sp. p3-SID957]